MDSLENLISDNEGNHLLVALDFYDDEYKMRYLHIPEEFAEVEVADISIEKNILDRPLNYRAFSRLTGWLLQQYDAHPDAIFTFICSIDPIQTRHHDILPQEYRWRLFDTLFLRAMALRPYSDIMIQDVIIGPEGFQSFGRAFYRMRHSPLIHLIASHLRDK